jgi:hypothetical protein
MKKRLEIYNYELIAQNKVFKRRRIIKNRKSKGYLFSRNNTNKKIILKDVIPAPADFRFIDNSFECLLFFNSVRSKEKCSIIKGQMIFRISLSKVEYIDFATISILKSIFEESKYYGINFRGNLPKDPKCKNFLINSGFLNNLYDSDSKEIKIKGKGEHFTFEKKEGIIKICDFENFEKISASSYKYITGNEGFCDEIITMLKEIGGNAIEWSDSYNKQWQIGIYFKEDKVVFNITDLGKGIIETLFISEKLKFIDFWTFRDNLDVLERVFQRKYGSLSQEINRNKGLPSIKKIHDENKINNLIVCSNNVILNFDNKEKSSIFKNDSADFYGTFYQWELNKKCIEYYGKNTENT